MYIVTHRTLFFIITGLILVGAIGSLVVWGLPLGIDFKGGSLMQIEYPEGRPEIATIQEQVATVPVGAISVRAAGDKAVNIRTSTLTPETHDAIIAALGGAKVRELAFTSVGPSLGAQFTNKALWALLGVVIAIVLYIAFAFRRVSRPVPSWGYGLTVVLMLAIDIIVPAGFFAAYAHFTGAEVDSLFVVALLALLGYCVNDVIVIFDRVREHLHVNEKTGVREDFEVTVGKSIDETMARSINTALTVVLALAALIWLGAEATRNFAIVMLVGVVIGTFSSIARSAPLLIPLAKWFAVKK